MSIERLQLAFIEAMSKYSQPNYKSSAAFNEALTMLAAILPSQSIVFSSFYPDSHNNEIHIKSHFYHEHNGGALVYAVNKFKAQSLPAIFSALDESTDEKNAEAHSLFSSLNFNYPTQQYDECTFYLVPFYTNGMLIGLLSYKAQASTQFKSSFSACYSVINAFFCSTFYREQAAIEKHTFQTVLDLMPQRVFWKNRDSVYMGCNKAFSQDASLPDPINIVGVTDHDIFPEQAELYRSDDANTMHTREHLISSEEPQTHKNGNTIWLRTSKRPVINSDNAVVGVVGTYDDITELKNIQSELSLAKDNLEKRVEERTQELKESNDKLALVITELKSAQNHLVETEKMAALGSLVAGVSHEINTPLGIAVTSASHLEDLSNSLKEKVMNDGLSKSEFISTCDTIMHSSDLIVRNLNRAAELIRNFKMIAVDQSNDDKRPIILKQYLQDVVSAMTPQTNAKNIKIFISGDDELSISTYPGTIAQIFTNLIANAMLHAFAHQDNGEISISYKVLAEELVLSFEDNGQGIDRDSLGKVFMPFYTTKRVEGGSGLGLSIVFNLVTQKLAGKISCESELNKWTRFTLSLPTA